MRRFQTLLLLPVLSGCSMMSVYEGGFDCPAGSGVGCKPISEVNEMINQGQIPPQDQENKNGDPLTQEKRGCSTYKVNITEAGEATRSLITETTTSYQATNTPQDQSERESH